MSANANHPDDRQVPLVPSGLAIREPPARNLYPSSPANNSFPYQPYILEHSQVQRHPADPYNHRVETQSQSFRSAGSGSLGSSDSQRTELEKQRLVQAWAFNSQPPSAAETQAVRRQGLPVETAVRQHDYVEHSRMLYSARPGLVPYPGFYVQGPQPHPAYHNQVIPHQLPPHHPVYRPPSNRPQSPPNLSRSRNHSPQQAMHDSRYHPFEAHHAMGRDPRDEYNRMGSPMAIGNLVGEYSDRVRMTHSPRREDPRASSRASGSGVIMTGLAAGMESPEHSYRSSRGERDSLADRESYGMGSYGASPDFVPDSRRTQHGTFEAQPAPFGVSQRNPQHNWQGKLATDFYREKATLVQPEAETPMQRQQGPESQNPRSSVVPGTPSERYDDSMDTDHDVQNVRIESPIPILARQSLNSASGGRRDVLVLNGLVSAERFSVVPPRVPKVVSPPRQNPPPLPSHAQGLLALQSSPNEESIALEATQRNDETIRSPSQIEIHSRQPRRSKSPPKAIDHPSSLHLPRPALTSGSTVETQDDTFIETEDRKAALRKRSATEIDNHMNGFTAVLPPDIPSPNKRKKAGVSGKVEIVLTGDQKTAGRGESHNRKPVALVAVSRTETTTKSTTKKLAKTPVKKQKISHSTVPAPEVSPPVRQNILFDTESRSSDIVRENTSDAAVVRVAPYRRLQKTSAAGSAATPLSGRSEAAVSLQGIDEWEKRGELVGLDDIDGSEKNDVGIYQEMKVVELITERRSEIRIPHENGETSPVRTTKRDSDTSLSPPPDEEEDEPTVQTLLIPSPPRPNSNHVKTYKSPTKQRKRKSVSQAGSGAAEMNSDRDDSEAEEIQNNIRSAKKRGRPARKIMSPTVSPDPIRHTNSSAIPSQSTDSLSDAPVEERWDDLPPPVMKDDPKDRDFRPPNHSQVQGSPHRKIATRRESTTLRPTLRAKRVLARWNDGFYPGDLFGKNKKKFVGQFDDGATFKLGSEDIRQCIFREGDPITMAKKTTPKLPVSGPLKVLGAVDADVDLSEPLMPDDKLLVRATNGNNYEIAVKYCIFEEEQENALDSREFEEEYLDILCGIPSSGCDTPKKPRRAGKAANTENPRKELRSTLRNLRGSDLRLDRIKPLCNFAFLISTGNVAGKTALTHDLKAKITDAGGRVTEDIFELYPKCRGERFGCDDITLAKHYQSMNGIFLLQLQPTENKPLFSEKFMMALALGIPCLSAAYIDDVLNRNETNHWHSYLLSAGPSQQLKSEVSQIVDLHTGEGPEYLVRKITGETVVRRPFNGQSFLIKPDVLPIVPYVCAAMGAELVIVAESKSRGRKATSATPSVISEVPSDYSLAAVDFIIVPNNHKSKIKKDEVAKTCNVEWIKQCLIMGKLYPPSLMDLSASSTGH